jgi:hypothetical protein
MKNYPNEEDPGNCIVVLLGAILLATVSFILVLIITLAAITLQ